ncbi:MAG: DegT/DnrJ/EryC1/StrS family aminotransferase [Candidatus Sigynarchaeota archaeon]
MFRKKQASGFVKFGDAEKKNLGEVIDSGELFYVNGEKTKKFCARVEGYFGVEYCIPTSSGTAAIHAAIGALEIPPGKEVITSPITDMGTLIGVLYQNLIPVFADVDPHTYNITAESIKAKITPETAAIIVVHLAGNAAEMDEIMNVANEYGIHVVEDCAQSYGAKYKGKFIGTIGKAGCYSLNAFKHISSGDGGFVITNDEELYVRTANFADKSYDRLNTGRRLTVLAPCYRITELQTAVALAQMDKLDYITRRRHELGDRFNKGIEGLDGIMPHAVREGNYCTYWFTMIRVDPALFSRDQFANKLKAEGIPASGGYIEKPIYMEHVFAKKSFFPGGIWPAERIASKNVSYKQGDCPDAEKVLATAIRININETQTEEMIDTWIEKVKKVHSAMSKR